MRTEYYNNTLCIEGGWLYENNNVMSESCYKALRVRGHLNVIRRGCKGVPSLIEFDTLPKRFKAKILEKFGDPYKKTKVYKFEDFIKPDPEAAFYYSNYKLEDGSNLPLDTQLKYRTNAEILNAIHEIIANKNAQRKALGGKLKRRWDKFAEVVNALDVKKYPHDLPLNPKTLQRKYSAYRKEGYNALIHKGFCNSNSRKVNDLIERLLLSLYALPNKPYGSSVHDLYLQFLGGAIDVVDVQTGELLNREDFYKPNGDPVVITDRTVLNYINNPKNRVLVDKYRNDKLSFDSTHRPHHHRTAPNYSLSKISMDDRDLPRKMHDGKRVKAYYAYDVTSGCIIGASYSKNKDKGLFIDCLRDMFRFLDSNGLGVPMEVEVEHHLVNNFKDDLMKAGIVFPFVRWANAGNSQEKWAETGNRLKKYGFEKKYQVGIGRFYAKLEANRPKQDKVWTEDGMQSKEQTFSYEQLVADDRQTIHEYNNALHHNQKKYKGMTRLEVFFKYVNPNLSQLNRALLARYIGNEVKTSIRRSQYVRVQYRNYFLPSPEVLAQLEPNNLEVKAYYIPTEDGIANEVYLYQNDEFICEATYLEKYNTATAEQTAKDKELIEQQASYVAKFDAMVKNNDKVARVEVIENRFDYSQEDPEVIETVEDQDQEKDLQEISADYDNRHFRNIAIDNL